MRKLTDNQMSTLISRLGGTSDSLSHALEILFDMDEEDISIDDCYELDSHIFCCEDCGWWRGQDCMADTEDGSWICEDCYDE